MVSVVAGPQGWHHGAYIQLIIAILILFVFWKLLDYSNVIVDLYVRFPRDSQLTDRLGQPGGSVWHDWISNLFRLGVWLHHQSGHFLVFRFGLKFLPLLFSDTIGLCLDQQTDVSTPLREHVRRLNLHERDGN